MRLRARVYAFSTCAASVCVRAHAHYFMRFSIINPRTPISIPEAFLSFHILSITKSNLYHTNTFSNVDI